MESQPPGGLAAQSPPARSPPRLLAPLPLTLLALNFYGGIFFLFLFSLSLSLFFPPQIKPQDDFLVPGDQNQQPGGSTPLGTAFILFQMKTLRRVRRDTNQDN